MSAITAEAVPLESLFAWERQIRPALRALEHDSAVRALVVGIAGSGKSRVLQHLHRTLAHERRPVRVISPRDADFSSLSASHALLVDDLHLLSGAQLVGLHDHAADPAAMIVATTRPWPWSPAAMGLARALEQSRPAIVLGHVARSDVLAHLSARGQSISDACLAYILEATGGVAWLVAEAIEAHDERDCAGDPTHGELRLILEERIAHRLDTIDPAVRAGLEVLALSPERLDGTVARAETGDDVVMRAFAEGLTTRAGRPVPLVRSCVRASVSPRRLLDLTPGLVSMLASTPAVDAADLSWVARTGDAAVGAALVAHADLLLDSHPERADAFYRAAREAGVAAGTLAGRRARAAWATGRLDEAAQIAAEAADVDDDQLTDASAAAWASRGMMSHASTAYRCTPPADPASTMRALIAGIGSGTADVRAAASDWSPELTGPTPLGVSLGFLRTALVASLDAQGARTALIDAIRAAEHYTSARTSAPIPELPAVVATTIALSLGETDTARRVLDDAISGDHGGEPARVRLQLWRAWVAVQSARHADAKTALARAIGANGPRTPRDELLARTTQVAIARRFEDAAGLDSAWARLRPALARIDVDLFLLLPLVELVSAGAKVGDTDTTSRHFEQALSLVDALGAPPLWAAHVRWAGIQQGILRGRPEELAPHARALVGAGATSAVAASMARAGRVWTSVLKGDVALEPVESAARGLAAIGLPWDAARLAGHGAGRTDDRRTAAALLSCARDLHPNDLAARPVADGAASGATPAQELLSERELDVARLVLQGKTYVEIGESIFISPRTAEHHIAHIRRRLGVTSRSEMLARLRVLIDGGDDADMRTTGGTDVSP